MPYTRSVHRREFEQRIAFLLKKARRAQRMRASDADIRDLVFQCAVFQASASTETYLRLLLESWAQNIKTLNKGAMTPVTSRAYLTSKRLEPMFAKYQFNGDEKALFSSIATQHALWPLMTGADTLPPFFSGQEFHEKSSYPSFKNIKRLFGRVGIDDMAARLNRQLARDVETLIEGFQSIRTALAHSSPPLLTIADVESLLGGAKELVGAIDRIFFRHVMLHGGTACWQIAGLPPPVPASLSPTASTSASPPTPSQPTLPSP